MINALIKNGDRSTILSMPAGHREMAEKLYHIGINIPADKIPCIGLNDPPMGIEAVAKAVLFQYPPGGMDNPLLTLLMMICFGYCVIKCFFSNIKRGGILLIQIAVGSLHLFGLPRGYDDGFTNWCKQVIAICFTTFMQTTLLYMGLLTMQNHALLGLGVMLAANEVPRIAERFGLETGTKPNVMSVVHTTSSAINLGRTIIRK